MNEEQIKTIDAFKLLSILDESNTVQIGIKDIKVINEYITKLQQENERLNTELNSYKDEFCKDTIKEYELVMEQEYYKSRCEKGIEFCDYLLEHNEVVINDKTYIKQSSDDVITNAIKSKLLGGDE